MATTGIDGASSSTGTTGNRPKNQNDALRDLDMSEFLNLMIAELQNQDPLSPMENAQILQQISQIREIGATSTMTDTLQSVLTGQNVSNASALIGKQIKGLTESGDQINGIVERVSISGGSTKLHVGNKELGLNNVREILPAAS